MQMRFRLATEPPLPPVKAWFSFLSSNTDDGTLHGLKVSICRDIRVLSSAQTRPGQISLSVDGFELLDELNADGIVKDGDLVIAKQKAVTGTKRKTSGQGPKIVKRRKTASSSGRPSSSSDSSSESSSSSSLESSDSDSDSSDSSNSSAPVVLRSRNGKPPNRDDDCIFVPPGLGSSKTHSRNRRRRLKKKFDASPNKLIGPPQPEPPKSVSQANNLPLGPRKTETSKDGQPPVLNMYSLGNKNKKKGYKQTLAPPSSQKIVFSAEDPSQVMDQPFLPRFIPPSEKQAEGRIPPNMFITSVDVEEGRWNAKRRCSQPKRQEVSVHEEANDVILDYGTGIEVEGGNEKIWADAEAAFDSLQALTSFQGLVHQQVLAWKALALNPKTFSPEIMLNLATVVQSFTDSIRVRILERHRSEAAEEEHEADGTEETWTLADANERCVKLVP